MRIRQMKLEAVEARAIPLFDSIIVLLNLLFIFEYFYQAVCGAAYHYHIHMALVLHKQ